MLFFIFRFIISWTIWIIFADKKRWRELFPVSIFAVYLASITDIIVHHYTLWRYHPSTLITELFDDTGIYIVVTYLFIQWLPKKKTFSCMFMYWFVWTGITITIEWIHIVTGHMEHYKWWNYGWSYLADWILFFLFYQFHKVFELKKLSANKH
jgi:hypothetical protein